MTIASRPMFVAQNPNETEPSFHGVTGSRHCLAWGRRDAADHAIADLGQLNQRFVAASSTSARIFAPSPARAFAL